MGVPTPQFSASATGRLVVYHGSMLVQVDAAAGLSVLGVSAYAKTLLDDVDAATARTTLALGTAAIQNTGTSGANVPLLNGANTWSAAQSITNATASTSTTTGALTVTGGIGVQGDAFFGRAVWANGANAQFVAEASSGNPRVLFNRVGVTKTYLDSNAGSFNVNSDASGTVGMFMLYSGSAWTAFSDARLPYKKTARPVTVLDKLDSIALYENEVNGRTELFVKAQEFYKAFPQIVKVGSDDPDYEPKGMSDPESWGVSYDRAGVAALQGLKELRAIVAALEEKIKGKKRGSNG